MQLIIPMAGKGTRMRPHTLTTPKPFLPIAGKPIIERLITTLHTACNCTLDTIGFIVHDLDEAVQHTLQTLAHTLGAQAKFYLQKVPKGTAHALLCAEELLDNPSLVAFADTLFTGNLILPQQPHNIVWVKKVPHPAAFGVVTVDSQQHVLDFVEKPLHFVSDLALVGIYYFQEGKLLKKALQQLVQQTQEEYHLTAALAAMREAGADFAVQEVAEWMDCGTKKAILNTNQRFLTLLEQHNNGIAATAQIHNSVILPPVYIGEHAVIKHTVIGPYVSVGNYSCVEKTRIKNSIIQEHSTIVNANVKHSMLGNYVTLAGKSAEVSMGDYTTSIG